MGINLDWPTMDEFLANLVALLYMVAHWLLESGYGPTILVTALVLLVLWAVAIIHGNVKAEDSFNIREDYWR